MQATWSDIDSNDNSSTTFEDARYNPKDFLAFIAPVESMHNNECDSDSDDGFTNDQKVAFF